MASFYCVGWTPGLMPPLRIALCLSEACAPRPGWPLTGLVNLGQVYCIFAEVMSLFQAHTAIIAAWLMCLHPGMPGGTFCTLLLDIWGLDVGT